MFNIYNYLNINNNSNTAEIIQSYKNKIKVYNNIELNIQQSKEIKILKICLYILSNKKLKKKYNDLLENNKLFNIFNILNNKFNDDNLDNNNLDTNNLDNNNLDNNLIDNNLDNNLIDKINEYNLVDNNLDNNNLDNFNQINDKIHKYNLDNNLDKFNQINNILITNFKDNQHNYKKKKIENNNLTNRIFNDLSSNNINILY